MKLLTLAAVVGSASAQKAPTRGGVVLHKIQSGQCGESALSSPTIVPYAQQNTPGLVIGGCADAGYDVPIGRQQLGTCPRCAQIDLFAPAGSEVCTAAQMAEIVSSCAVFASTSDAAVCGSPCERAARALLADGSCFAMGEVHELLDAVTATCAGYVAVDGAEICHSGLYFEAYSDIPESATFKFAGGDAYGGWSRSGQLVDRYGHLANIDAWLPTVEHPEHTTDLSYASTAEFIKDIKGFTDADQFVMRWRGTFTAPTAGDYLFSTTSDDGSMLYMDGAAVVRNDGLHSATTRSGSVALDAGAHSIMVVFFENGGGASITAHVTMPGQKRAVLGGDMVRRGPSAVLPLQSPIYEEFL
jgi:hypothetical protein